MNRSSAVLLSVVALVLALVGATPAVAAPPAPDAPGALSHFDLARKDCVGTARNTTSKAWYTVANGVLSDVYAPTIDNTNVETLQFVVTDGSTFTDLQTRDTTYTVRATDDGGMACQVTSTARNGRYRIVTDYIADPARTAVIMRTKLEPLHGKGKDLKLYVRYDASINGNGGGGPVNGGGDMATVDSQTTALVSTDTNTVTSAPNRDYAVPLSGALRADKPFLATSSGYAGTPSDGLNQLDAAHELTDTTADAPNGNVVQTARLDVRSGKPVTLALGFGATPADAVRTAGASVRTPFPASYHRYVNQWRDYDRHLHQVHAPNYLLSANVLKASEDKTFPGAIVASLGSPWGQAISAGDAPGGKPVYFGSYREIFSRDLYESVTGLLAAGDLATARASVRWLFERQQQADGRFPRNSMLNGRKAPDSGGDQLDETAYPILLARQTGLDRDHQLYTEHIRPAADFLVAHGPSFGSERWEEQGGYSPSTIAAEIAGLVSAGDIADRNHDPARAKVYRATADHFQRSIKDWAVTTTGPYADGHYFIRLSKTGDPDAAITYNLGNGSIDVDQRAVMDAGFLELVRLGELSPNDPDVRHSLAVLDGVIKRDTPNGPGWYRYGTSAQGSEDGYGDCYEPDATNCTPSGKPWPTGNVGSGHLWPVLGGERGEQRLTVGDRRGAAAMLDVMRRQAFGVGLVPEQLWENPALAASPFGSDPTTASIGFTPGVAAGSVAPLTWAQSQYVRLARGIQAGRPVEQPSNTRDRYRHAPAALSVTVTGPERVETPNASVTGTAPAGSKVAIAASAVDGGGATTVVSTVADRDGKYSVTVPTPLGSNVITATATTRSGTGYAQTTIVSDYVQGTVLMDVTDPDGDDNGPGTFAYPTAGDFHAGAFDIQRFQVLDSGDTIVFRTTLRDLTPTFGSPLGAQLLDVYLHDPAATETSTAAPYPSRGYTVAAQDAWSRMVEVQGFADPTYTDPGGTPLGGASVQASQGSRTITITVPKATLGTPGPGWTVAVVLSGQDGNSPDQARPFTATPQAYTFGVCAQGGTAPICGADPSTMPKTMDVLVPAGVDQATELNPTLGPVEVRGVPVE